MYDSKDRKILLKRAVYLILLIFLLNSMANWFYWYSTIWYFDMIMHFLGGFWLGLSFFLFFGSPELSLKLVGKVVVWVLVIGIGWELFELLFYNQIAQNPFNMADTFSDIFFDLAGGLSATLYFLRKTIPFNENKL